MGRDDRIKRHLQSIQGGGNPFGGVTVTPRIARDRFGRELTEGARVLFIPNAPFVFEVQSRRAAVGPDIPPNLAGQLTRLQLVCRTEIILDNSACELLTLIGYPEKIHTQPGQTDNLNGERPNVDGGEPSDERESTAVGTDAAGSEPAAPERPAATGVSAPESEAPGGNGDGDGQSQPEQPAGPGIILTDPD